MLVVQQPQETRQKNQRQAMNLAHNVSDDDYCISAIPAFDDNYLWLLQRGQRAAVIDPGDGDAVIQQLERRQLTLDYILITHHHPDHTGGIEQLQQRYGAEVIGPDSARIPQVTTVVGEGEKLPRLGLTLDVISVPGHTLDHIAYFIATPNPLGSAVLFCGDTLFAGGCGRVFEGSYEQMHHSLNKLKQLPRETLIYCAHEYTEANLRFALQVEGENPALLARAESVAEQRARGEATVPSSLAEELASNPFLRCDKTAVIAAAETRLGQPVASSDVVFATIRRWKDGN